MINKNHTEILAQTKMQSLPGELRRLMTSFEEVQEQVLLDILRYSENTEFGIANGFAQIKNPEEYCRKFPITEYKDYKEAVVRMENGEADILFPGKAESFVVTTGTTGAFKNIPESAEGAKVKEIVGRLRTAEIVRMAPRILMPGHNILAITNPSVCGRTRGGIPIGTASGQAAGRGPMAEKMTLPEILLTDTEMSSESLDYLTAAFAAADRDIALLVCNNTAQFDRIMRLLNTQCSRILCDIKTGRLSVPLPEKSAQEIQKLWKEKAACGRAEELENIYRRDGKFTVKALWPKFSITVCWLSGSVGRTAREFRKDFPEDTMFLDWGYGASEGKFNIPVTPETSEGYPAIFGLFFELLPEGSSETVLLHEAQPGIKYELVITSYSGLYRYNMHDMVTVARDKNGIPMITFLCKSKDRVEINGKSFYSSDLIQIIEEYESDRKVFFRLIQGEKIQRKFRLYAEPDGNVDAADFENYISEKLKEKNIEQTEVVWKEDGYRNSMLTEVVAQGKSLVSTKLPVFIRQK